MSDGTRGVGAGAIDFDAAAVDARKLARRYPGTWALRAVDLRVERGELVCLLGPNGSGKSTLLRILAGASRPTLGCVRIFGVERRKVEAVAGLIGFLSHQTYLYAELTGRENLRFAATMYGLDASDARLDEALATVGLADAADAQVRTYSSGMTKRLSLARATLHDPDIVLLDEPYGALDADGIEWLEGFIRGLRGTGRTLLVATHEASRALELADRAVMLRSGRIVYDGPAAGFTAPAEAGT